MFFFFYRETSQRLNYQHRAAENQKGEQEFLRASGTEQVTTSKASAGEGLGGGGVEENGRKRRVWCELPSRSGGGDSASIRGEEGLSEPDPAGPREAAAEGESGLS